VPSSAQALKNKLGDRSKRRLLPLFSFYNSSLVWFRSASGSIFFSLQNNHISEQRNLIENEQVVVEGGF
jgi:hypothetical protein